LIEKHILREDFMILAQLNKYYKLLGSILPVLSIFVFFKLNDQDGNWTLAALLIIVSAVLFAQTGGLKHE